MRAASCGQIAPNVSTSSGKPRSPVTASAADLRIAFLKHKEMVTRWTQRSLKFHGSNPRIAHAALTAALLASAEMIVGRSKVEEFADGILDWKALPDGHPAGALAAILVAIPSRGSRAKMHQSHVAALVVKSLNAFLNDQRIKTLSWRLNENFPTLDVESTD